MMTHFYNRMVFLSFFFLTLLPFKGKSQTNRTIDGTENNLTHVNFGAVGTNQLSIVINGFEDLISTPSGSDRPNPRTISNNIFNQIGSVPDALEISDYAFAWGQFIDHDITLVGEDHSEPFDILVPTGDTYFDPFQTGDKTITLFRSDYDPTSGTSIDNPRAFPNQITAFIDASTIYGSNQERADWLRSFEGGKLKTSAGNLLPYNTISGAIESATDPNAPEMAMPFDFINRWFISGDVRANENALLTSLHTLFMREHNRLCDVYALDNPEASDEELYQKARKTVGAIIQAICYEEWLPTLGLELPDYDGYNPDINPGILNVFSAAAYRYGHTVINSKIVRMNNDGQTIPEGDILLRDAFFNPTAISSVGLDPYFIGMGTQVEQDFDCKMIDDLRNFLFGPPGSGGLDLASINIQRGRERGLPDYNTIRTNLGLPAMQNFEDISNNSAFTASLQNTYSDINNIDPWVGFLGESHMSNALFGETVMLIMERQFSAIRDGDRYFYENDEAFSDEEKEAIRNTHLKDVILRNTGVELMQENVFLMAPHTVGSKDIFEEPIALNIYPNPTNERLNIDISSPQKEDITISVFDMIGHLIYTDTRTLDSANDYDAVDVSNWPAGMYNVSINTKTHTLNKRFVVPK